MTAPVGRLSAAYAAVPIASARSSWLILNDISLLNDILRIKNIIRAEERESVGVWREGSAQIVEEAAVEAFEEPDALGEESLVEIYARAELSDMATLGGYSGVTP